MDLHERQRLAVDAVLGLQHVGVGVLGKRETKGHQKRVMRAPAVEYNAPGYLQEACGMAGSRAPATPAQSPGSAVGSVSLPNSSIQRATNLPVHHMEVALLVAPKTINLAAQTRLLVEHRPLRAKRSPIRHSGAPRFVLGEILIGGVATRISIEQQLDVLRAA